MTEGEEMVQAQLNGQSRAVLEKLAGFRNGLDSREQQILDSVVAHALGAPADREAASGDIPPEAEVEALVHKVETFESALPVEEQRRLDALLSKGSREEAEVEAHQMLWSMEDSLDNYYFYSELCTLGTGGIISWIPVGEGLGQYECWRW